MYTSDSASVPMPCAIMTSSNGNIFRVTGPLCGEFTGPGEFAAQRPVTRSLDVFFDLRLNNRLSKQPWGWWFETPSWSLWRHCNVPCATDKLPVTPATREIHHIPSGQQHGKLEWNHVSHRNTPECRTLHVAWVCIKVRRSERLISEFATKETALQNVVCDMAAILFPLQCVN